MGLGSEILLNHMAKQRSKCSLSIRSQDGGYFCGFVTAKGHEDRFWAPGHTMGFFFLIVIIHVPDTWAC